MAKVKEQLWPEPEIDYELMWSDTTMHISKMSNSKFLKKEDVDPPILVTITAIDQQDVAMEGQTPEVKWALHFAEIDKPMVLNLVNLELCAEAIGSEETNDWVHKKIVLFNDPTVKFGHKTVGGIRIRASKQPQQPVPEQPAQVETFDDEIPF